jgi:hypothetical protein
MIRQSTSYGIPNPGDVTMVFKIIKKSIEFIARLVYLASAGAGIGPSSRTSNAITSINRGYAQSSPCSQSQLISTETADVKSCILWGSLEVVQSKLLLGPGVALSKSGWALEFEERSASEAVMLSASHRQSEERGAFWGG